MGRRPWLDDLSKSIHENWLVNATDLLPGWTRQWAQTHGNTKSTNPLGVQRRLIHKIAELRRLNLSRRESKIDEALQSPTQGCPIEVAADLWRRSVPDAVHELIDSALVLVRTEQLPTDHLVDQTPDLRGVAIESQPLGLGVHEPFDRGPGSQLLAEYIQMRLGHVLLECSLLLNQNSHLRSLPLWQTQQLQLYEQRLRFLESH